MFNFISRLIKMDDDELKEKCVYIVDQKNDNELFEVLELDVDDMENVEMGHESSEPCEEEMGVDDAIVKCETTAIRKMRKTFIIFNYTFSFYAGSRSSSELNECNSNEIGHYEFQDDSDVPENELFSIDNSTSDPEPSKAKRVKINITSDHTEPTSKSVVVEKVSTLCEFDIFGNYVAAVMKNMKKNDARQLQMKIVQLINSYDEDESV